MSVFPRYCPSSGWSEVHRVLCSLSDEADNPLMILLACDESLEQVRTGDDGSWVGRTSRGAAEEGVRCAGLDERRQMKEGHRGVESTGATCRGGPQRVTPRHIHAREHGCQGRGCPRTAEWVAG